MKNTTTSHLTKPFFKSLLLKSGLLTLIAISLFASAFAQTVPCNQRLISNADFTYNGGGTEPARWNLSQANASGFSIDQTAFTYVPTGNFANQNLDWLNPNSNPNTTRQYAVVRNPQDLNPQYANIATDGMIVINPLQAQNDQYGQFQVSGLQPGQTYYVEMKIYNVLDMTAKASDGGCHSWCNWNSQLNIEWDGNGNNPHDGQSSLNWSGMNGSNNQSGTWNGNSNQMSDWMHVTPNGAYATLTGQMTLGNATSGFTFTFLKQNAGSNNPIVLGIDYIKVYGCQQEAINISGGTPSVCEASQFTLTAQGIGPAGSTYSWYKNGTLISGSTADTLNVISGLSAGVADTYKAVGAWDNISTTLTSKLCCSSVGGTQNEVFRQSFNGLTYTCTAGRSGGYADIPAGGTIDQADYTYSGLTCDGLNDGHYAVVQSSFAGDYWRTRPEVKDHTGVAGSGALFINAAGNAGQAFYTFNLNGLCIGTTYEFTIWYASLATGSEIKPNIQFNVLMNGNSTPIATTSTGVIPVNEQWYEADVTFTTPSTPGATFTLQAVNLVSGSSGNDLMLDDIVVQKCNPAINLFENGTTDSVVSVCDNNPVNLKVSTLYDLPTEITGSPTGTVYYQWMSSTIPNAPDGSWTLLGTPETTGTYAATPVPTLTYYRAKVSSILSNAANGNTPKASDCGNDGMTYSFSLIKGGNFTIPPITGTTSYCPGNTMTLTGDPGTGDEWEWRKGNTATTATPITGYAYSNNAANKVYSKTFAITDTGNYYFYSKTTAGCESYSTVHVTANPAPTITTAATASGVCISTSAQTSNLTYSATTGTPTTYTITWDAAGITAGLVNVASTNIPASPIGISVPANTQTGTFTGTIVVSTAGGCTSTGSTFTLTVNPLPTITVAATADSLCVSSSNQKSNLTYSATTGTPTKYSITWSAAGLSAGLVNIGSTGLSSSPIVLTVPGNTLAGTYTGTIAVTNANNCASSGTTTFTLTVNNILSPTDISCGTATNSSVQFNWTALPNATSYTISHTVNGGASISDASTTAGTYSYGSLNPGDVIVITVLPVGPGCYKSASFTCAATTCPVLTGHTSPADITICNTGTVTYTETASAGGTITWTNSNTAIGLGASGSGTANVLTINFTATNPTASSITGKIGTITTFTNGAGTCNYPDSFKIIVTPSAVATLTSASSTNPQTVCINNAITNITYSITGTGNNATASGLPNGVNGTYNAGVFTISGTPTQTGTFNYTVTATGTCANGTATGTINVTALPVISSVTPTNPSTCGGSDGSFTINGLAASATYTVNFNKNGTAQTAQIITANGSGSIIVGALQQGTYDGITVTTGGSCTSTAATTTLSDPSVFNPIASSNSPCAGGTLNLVSTTSTDPSASYAWTGPGNYAASGATPNITNTTTAMSGTYTVKAIVAGCTSSTTVTVTINAIPNPPIGTGKAICGSNTVILTALQSGANTDNLTWYNDAALTMPTGTTGGTFTTPTITATTPYYVVETSVANCTSTATTVTATINSVPSAPTAVDSFICGPGLVVIGATPVTNATDTIKWYNNAGLNNKLATGTIFQTPSISTTTPFYATATTTQGCTSTTATTVTASINTKPDAQLTPFGAVCEDHAVFALSGGTPAGGNYSGGLGVISDSAFDPQMSGPGSFLITYTYTAANGCYDTASKPINVYAGPVINYGGTVSVFENDSVTLSPVKPAAAGLLYTWTPSIYLDNPTSATPVCKPADSVTYTITAQSPGGCQGSTILFVQVLHNFIVPNTFTPNNDGINDKWVIPQLPNFPVQWVQVFDRYGQLLYESHGYSTPWDGTYNGKPLPAGTYYYIIELNGTLQPKTGYVTILR